MTNSRTENRRLDADREFLEVFAKLLDGLYEDGLKQERTTLDKGLRALEELLHSEDSSIQLREFVEAAKKQMIKTWERGAAAHCPAAARHPARGFPPGPLAACWPSS